MTASVSWELDREHEEFRASGRIAVTAVVTGYMSTPHIAQFGTGEQRARHLPGLVAGGKLASIAVTEPGAGSDVAGLQAAQQAVAADAAPTA